MDATFTGIVSLEIDESDQMLEDLALQILVSGETPLPYVKRIRARFDQEPVVGLAIDLYGTGFTGYLKNRPAANARLFVEFDGQEPIDTGLDFEPGEPET
jgi:hypothetical protein